MNIIKPFDSDPSNAHIMGVAKYLHSHMMLASVANIIIASLSIFLLWDSAVPTRWLVSWWSLMMLICFARLLVYSLYRFRFLPNITERFWVVCFGAFVIVSGIMWGATSIFFARLDTFYQAIMVAMVTGLAVGALPMLAPLKWTYLVYVFICLVPVSVSLMMIGEKPQLVLGLLGGFLLFCLYRSGDLLFGVLVKLKAEANESQVKALEIARLLDRLRCERDNAKRAAELAKVAQSTAEQASKEKSRFLAAASHDLRQPLHALGLFVHAMEPHIDEAGRDIFENINATLQCTDELFNSLLDISKLEAGVTQTNIQHFSVQSVFDRLYARHCAEAVSKQIAFRMKSSHYIVKTDPYYMEQLLGNLISNAIKYTKRGAVLVGCRYKGDFVEIEVRDSGVGISIEDQKVIFDEFVQLGNPERDRRKGLGLGLAIVNHISRLLRFDLKLVSAERRGSTFKIKIPTGDKRQISQTQVIDFACSVSLFNNVRILLIEDEKDICDAMSELLNTWGGKCLVADNVDNAIAKYDLYQLHPDIIVSDLRLADSLDGMDQIYRLRDYLGVEVPAVIVTGDTAPEVLRRVEDSGFALLHKPIMPPRFRMLLQHLLDKKVSSVEAPVKAVECPR